MTKKYRISAYIYTPAEDEHYFTNIEDAREELEHLNTLQPENIYVLEEVEVGTNEFLGIVEVVREVK